MNFTFRLLVLIALMELDFSVAFSVASRPGQHSMSADSTITSTTSTCLFAEPEPTPDAEGMDDNNNDPSASNEGTNDKPTGADDILNSPAFLKRKIDVLRSDIAKTEEAITDAKLRLDAGKVEWGGQLDELQKEVRICVFLFLAVVVRRESPR
jgi:hypothetical protein